jgi:hypothetical protein
MKKSLFSFLLLSALATGVLSAQSGTGLISDSLERLYKRLLTNQADSDRVRINDSINQIIADYAHKDSLFGSRLTKVKNLGQLISADSVVKILNWNVLLKNEPCRYYCYIIRKSGDDKPNQVWSFVKQYDPKPVRPDTVYSESDWYGALYYDVKPFSYNGSRCWILLGINYSDPAMTKKIIEILHFSGADGLVFGKNWFDNGKTVNYRHILEYSNTATITLRFRSDNAIVFDHLVPVPRATADGRLEYGPDYSYDALTFKDGLWHLSVNVDARNQKK